MCAKENIMVSEYTTIKDDKSNELVEKKSRFIAYIRAVYSEEEALDFIEKIKKKHYDARHNCHGYVVVAEPELRRFSDDGEPSGTAGKSILEALDGAGLSNVCIVVTRYFGGTLLGTGGLTRAYRDAAKLAIEECEYLKKQLVRRIDITASYNDYGKIKYFFEDKGIKTANEEYSDNVSFSVNAPVSDAEMYAKKLVDLTAAKALIKVEDDSFWEEKY